MGWWNRGPRGEGTGPTLADECEAFLAGRLVEYRDLHDQPVPSWAWLNRLAHARGAELLVLSAGGFPCDPPEWRQALAYLAREVLDRAETAGGVTQVQRRFLVPLELQLIDEPGSRYLSASQLAARVLEKLERAPGRANRPPSP